MSQAAYIVRSSDSNPMEIWESQVTMYKNLGLVFSKSEAEDNLERAHMIIRFHIFQDMLNHYFHGEDLELDEYGDQEVQEVTINDDFYK